MTASEFAFLSFGLVLGVLSGAALVEILRSRPPAPREVRLTVTPDSVPRRRGTTLVEDAFVQAEPEPGVTGRCERHAADALPTNEGRRAIRDPRRTDVRAPLPPAGAGDPASSWPVARPTTTATAALAAPQPAAAAGAATGATPATGTDVAVTIHREPDPTLAALLNLAGRRDARAPEPRPATTATLDRVAAAAPPPEPGSPGHADATSSASEASSGPCDEPRRVADERCAVATRAREEAQRAADVLRAAHRSYDEHVARAEHAATTADPRAIRSAKETAQQRFRAGRAGATDREAIEAAARDWLTEINRINRAAREAVVAAQHEREAAAELTMRIERLTVEADVARIAADTADAACITARQEAADCQEAQATAASGHWPAAPSGGVGGGVFGLGDDESELEAAFTATGAGEPAILRLLRGDRATLGRIVRELAGDDPGERRRWQLALAELVDAIVTRAIEASALTFPFEHRFWGGFTLGQNRDIVAALASLGYRFDGLGGWVDDRIPSQRDLSLAVGYAGLDPMRIRHWPSEADTRNLFKDVAVAADAYLADTAGGLTLGELVDLLGRRADAMADLWNDWGRVRPLLLAGG